MEAGKNFDSYEEFLMYYDRKLIQNHHLINLGGGFWHGSPIATFVQWNEVMKGKIYEPVVAHKTTSNYSGLKKRKVLPHKIGNN